MVSWQDTNSTVALMAIETIVGDLTLVWIDTASPIADATFTICVGRAVDTAAVLSAAQALWTALFTSVALCLCARGWLDAMTVLTRPVVGTITLTWSVS